MAQPYVSGPCPIYCGVGTGGNPLFLGHAEKFPRISIRPHWSPMFVDLAGQGVAYDYVYDGEEAFVVADVTRWNESVYALMADRAKTGAAAALSPTDRGTNGFGEIGTLMMTEAVAYGLWIVFPYTAKAFYTTQPAGYQFFSAMLEGPDELDLGSTARKTRMVWHCIRQVQPGMGGTTVKGANNYGGAIQFGLYDNNVSATAGVPVN